MEVNAIIRNSFNNPKVWMFYFNLINSLYSARKIEVVHDAKTISVALTCLRLKETYGFSFINLYDCTQEQFSGLGNLRLSRLVNLSEYKSFVDSIGVIEDLFIQNDERPLNIHKPLLDYPTYEHLNEESHFLTSLPSVKNLRITAKWQIR